MSFQEKSAWLMLVALLLCSLLYSFQITSMTSSLGELPRPTIPAVVNYTIILVLVAIVGHIAIAISAPKEANASIDERESQIFDRAANLASHVYATGAVLSLALYLTLYDGNVFFYAVLGSLVAGQLSAYASRIYFYRVGP